MKPGGRGKIHEHPNANKNGFAQRPEQAGRKKGLFKRFSEECERKGIERATNLAIVQSFELLLGLPESEIQAIAYDETGKYPGVLTIMAKQLLDPKKADLVVEKMLDRSHGKAAATVKLEGVTQAAMPQDAAAQLAAILGKIKDESEGLGGDSIDEDPHYSTMPPPEDE